LIAACQNEAPFPSIADYTFKQKADYRFKLAGRIKETSGLAVDKYDRLFTHNDESATIFELNKKNGKIIKQFYVGDKKVLKADFEGLAIVDSIFYLVKSNGDIIEFKEGRAEEMMSFHLYKNDLSKKIEIEGLCYDNEQQQLLMISKSDKRKKQKLYRSIFAFSLTEKKMEKTARFKLLIKEITALNLIEKDFGPSGIEYNQKTKHFFIIAHISKLIVEIDEKGQVIAVDQLINHRQPEGITFLSDGSCLIADEGGSNAARLSIYRKRIE